MSQRFRILLVSVACTVVFSMLLAKRTAPKSVVPVVVGSIQYSAPHAQMGCVLATDLATGRELWRQQIYRVMYKPALERDVQDVFITSLTIRNGTILILNERSGKYTLDLATRKVLKIQE